MEFCDAQTLKNDISYVSPVRLDTTVLHFFPCRTYRWMFVFIWLLEMCSREAASFVSICGHSLCKVSVDSNQKSIFILLKCWWSLNVFENAVFSEYNKQVVLTSSCCAILQKYYTTFCCWEVKNAVVFMSGSNFKVFLYLLHAFTLYFTAVTLLIVSHSLWLNKQPLYSKCLL